MVAKVVQKQAAVKRRAAPRFESQSLDNKPKHNIPIVGSFGLSFLSAVTANV